MLLWFLVSLLLILVLVNLWIPDARHPHGYHRCPVTGRKASHGMTLEHEGQCYAVRTCSVGCQARLAADSAAGPDHFRAHYAVDRDEDLGGLLFFSPSTGEHLQLAPPSDCGGLR